MTINVPAGGHCPTVLLHAFPTFAVGGAQTRFAAIANHFGPRYRHLIVSLDGVVGCSDRLRSNVDYRLVPVQLPKQRMFRNVLQIRKLLLMMKPDVLVTYNWGSIEWAAANIVPLSRHIHIEDGFGPEEVHVQMKRRILFRRLILSPWTQVVLPSRNLYRISADTWRLPQGHLHYLPNGIDCDRFAKSPDGELCRILGLTAGELIIGTVAALRPEKNLGRLIDAFARVLAAVSVPMRLLIVGDGAERPRLDALVRKLGLGGRVVFSGGLKEPERLLGALDIFALSSDTEQMPYSILEAMAAGLPIASVGVGDVNEMLAPENRPLVVDASAEALAGSILRLVADRAMRMEIGRANAAYVRRHFRQEAMFEAYAQLFGT